MVYQYIGGVYGLVIAVMGGVFFLYLLESGAGRGQQRPAELLHGADGGRGRLVPRRAPPPG